MTRADQLHLYKTATDVKTYNLANLKKILLGSGQNSTHVKMSLRNGEKLYLKIKGPDRLDWGARITQCKFREEKPLSTMPSSPLAPPTPMPPHRMGYRHYVTDSSETTSSIHLGYSPATSVARSVASMQPTQHPQEEDETTDMDESLVARMAKIFEPEYRPKTGTLPRRIR